VCIPGTPIPGIDMPRSIITVLDIVNSFLGPAGAAHWASGPEQAHPEARPSGLPRYEEEL
jgi:hypothetical protein